MRNCRRAEDAEILALIPARGGSKGIPRKNLLPIAGRPAIAYSIEHAKQSLYIDRVVVSTDDPEIAYVAQDWGAEVPFLRPAQFSGDLSADIEVFHHALTFLRQHEAYECDYVVHLRPPTVLRSVADIDEAIELIVEDPHADTLRSVHPAPLSPYKMWLAEGNYLEPLLSHPEFAEPQSLPRQLLPQVMWQNGYVDIIRANVIMRRRMSGNHVLPFVIQKEVPELDYPEDIEKLENWIKLHGLSPAPRGGWMAARHAA